MMPALLCVVCLFSMYVIYVLYCVIFIHLQPSSDIKSHIFPFFQLSAEGDISTLYKQISTTMLKIHSGKMKDRDLVVLAKKW